MDKLAVIILNWNGVEMLEQYLHSVVSFSQLEGVTVWVADNGSTDQSIQLLESEYPTVSLLKLDENYGFAEGYNRAIQAIEAEYIVLLNSDVEVTPHWLEPIITYLNQHPETAACQPKILSWHSKDHFEYAGAAGGFIDKWGYPFCRGRIMDTLERDEGQYDTVVPLFWATGAALCIRRTVYLEVGGLDPRFFAHMEEIDLCWRLGARGYKIMAIPQSTVYHVGGGTLDKSNPRKTFLNFRNNLLMLYKNLPDQKLKKVMLMRLILDYIAILVFILKGNLKFAQAVYKARKEYHALKKSFSYNRKENLSVTVAEPKGVLNGSLIWSYYLRRKNKFTQICENINI